MTIRVGDHFVDPALARVRFQVDVSRERVDLAIHHPAFGHLAPDLRANVAHALLVAAFGEDGVARWIGTIDVATAPPEPSVDLALLERAVRSLSENATGERFAVLEGKDGGGRPVLVLVNRALKRIDHPALDRHLVVEATFASPKPDGFPGADEDRALDLLEKRLVDGLRGHAAFLGRVTGAGKRTLHFFGDAGATALAESCLGAPSFVVRVVSRPDPTWDAQRALAPC